MVWSLVCWLIVGSLAVVSSCRSAAASDECMSDGGLVLAGAWVTVERDLCSRALFTSRPCLVGYLVDPASSHMLVSKTKPCMCKYKRLNRETANGSLNQL